MMEHVANFFYLLYLESSLLSVAYFTVANLARLGMSVRCNITISKFKEQFKIFIHELFPQNIPSWVFDKVLRTPLSLYLNGFLDVDKVCFVFKDYKGVFQVVVFTDIPPSPEIDYLFRHNTETLLDYAVSFKGWFGCIFSFSV